MRVSGEIALFSRRLKMLPAGSPEHHSRGKTRESFMPLSSCCAVHVGANTFASVCVHDCKTCRVMHVCMLGRSQ